MLKVDEVCKMLGVCKAQLYRMIKDGFPKPIKISRNASRWLVDEVDQWLIDRKNERYAPNLFNDR